MGLLPGQKVKFQGGLCEDCGEPAILTIVGETDSFGSEFITLCNNCYEQMINQEPETMICDYCKKDAICHPTRDYTEGSNGPVYYICSECSRKQYKDLEKEYLLDLKEKEELESLEDYYRNQV